MAVQALDKPDYHVPNMTPRGVRDDGRIFVLVVRGSNSWPSWAA